MANRDDKKIHITGRTVCIIAGLLAAIAFLYWFLRAFAYEDRNVLMIVSSFCVSFFLLWVAKRKK